MKMSCRRKVCIHICWEASEPASLQWQEVSYAKRRAAPTRQARSHLGSHTHEWLLINVKT